METHRPKRHRSSTTVLPRPRQPATAAMEDGKEEILPIPNLIYWFIKLASFQAEIVNSCLVTLFSPIFSLFSLVSESFYQAEEAKESVESAVTKVPSKVARGSGLLLRRLGFGLLGAAYACMVLIILLFVAVVVAVGLVQVWVEEPVLVREQLHFDYTDVHPKAVFGLGSCRSSATSGGFVEGCKKKAGVPVGHTFYVSLILLMPESDFNRDMGMFQLIAEIISSDGDIISKSSQPCMMRFRSLPVRLLRTFVMGIPLLLGITAETQKISIAMLKHKEESHPRSEAIRVTLIPRAGTPTSSSLPQLYEAEIVLNSELPWRKELVRSWKWTFYVWTSLCVYLMLLVLLLCCFRRLLFPVFVPVSAGGDDDGEREYSKQEEVQEEGETAAAVCREEEEREVVIREASESVRRWQESRNKRRAMLEAVACSSASSFTITTREDQTLEEEEEEEEEDDAGDSESVCFRD